MLITIDSLAYKKIMAKLDNLEKAVRKISPDNANRRWIDEAETMTLTGLRKSSLLEKRKSGVFNFSAPNGRKVRYLRKDVERYLENNSTLR